MLIFPASFIPPYPLICNISAVIIYCIQFHELTVAQKFWTRLRRILRHIGGASQFERYLFAIFFTVQLTAAAAGVCGTRFCWCRRWMGTPRPLPGWLVSPLKFMPGKMGLCNDRNSGQGSKGCYRRTKHSLHAKFDFAVSCYSLPPFAGLQMPLFFRLQLVYHFVSPLQKVIFEECALLIDFILSRTLQQAGICQLSIFICSSHNRFG